MAALLELRLRPGVDQAARRAPPAVVIQDHSIGCYRRCSTPRHSGSMTRRLLLAPLALVGAYFAGEGSMAMYLRSAQWPIGAQVALVTIGFILCAAAFGAAAQRMKRL